MAKKSNEKEMFSYGSPPIPRAGVATARPKQPSSKSVLTHQQVAERAKAIWQSKGCPAGQDEQNWREAEAQLKAELGLG